MGRVETPLDATTKIGVLKSNGTLFFVDLVTTADLDANVMAALVTAVGGIYGAPAVPRPGWTPPRSGALAPAGISLAGLFNVVMLTSLNYGGPVTIDNLGITILGTGTGVLRLGVISLNTTGTPVTFMGDYGTVSVTSTGRKAVGAFTPLPLPPATYMLATCWQGDQTTPPTIDAYIGDDPRMKHVDSFPPSSAIAGGFGGTLLVPNLVTGAYPGTLGGLGSTALVSAGGVGFAPRTVPHILSSP